MAQDMADANEHAEPAAAVVVEGGAAKSHSPRRERGPRRDRPPRSEQQQRDQPLPEYDESKLIKAKSGKVVQPAKPDPTERDVALEKLSGEVKRLGDRIAAIKEQKAAAQRKGAKRSSVPLPPEAAQHRQARQALQEQWSAELKLKQRVREEFTRHSTEREVLRNDLREARGKMPKGIKPDALDSELQQAEFKLAHETLTAQEEKALQARLSALTAARPAAKAVAALEERLKAVEGRRAEAKKKLDAHDATLSAIKAKQQAESAAIDVLRKQAEGDVPEEPEIDVAALDVEKQESWDIMVALRAKAAEIRAEFDARWKVWAELNGHYKAWERHDKHRQYLERQKAREERAAAAKEQEQQEGGAEEGQQGDGQQGAAAGQGAERAGPSAPGAGADKGSKERDADAFDPEVFRIDQLLAYLRKFQAAGEQGPAKESKAVEVPQGLKPFQRKEEDLSFFTAVSQKHVAAKAAGGGSGSGSARPGSAAKPSSAAAPAAPAVTATATGERRGGADPKRKLNHSLDILQALMTLGVDVPNYVSEIGAAATKVEEKKKELLERRKQGRAPREVQVLQADGSATTAPPKGKGRAAKGGRSEAKEEEMAEGKDVGVSLSVDEAAKSVSLKLKL